MVGEAQRLSISRKYSLQQLSNIAIDKAGMDITVLGIYAYQGTEQDTFQYTLKSYTRGNLTPIRFYYVSGYS